MRRGFALFSVILLLFAASCGEDGGDTGDRLDEWLASVDSFTAEVAITAEFADRTVGFRLDCAVSEDVCAVKVIEPADIEGIEVAIEPSGVSVSYDSASFEAGSAADLGVQPVTAVAELYRLFGGAVISERGSEKLGECECLTAVYLSGTSETRVWFDSETLAPVRAEFFSDGVRTLSCEFVSFVMGGS